MTTVLCCPRVLSPINSSKRTLAGQAERTCRVFVVTLISRPRSQHRTLAHHRARAVPLALRAGLATVASMRPFQDRAGVLQHTVNESPRGECAQAGLTGLTTGSLKGERLLHVRYDRSGVILPLSCNSSLFLPHGGRHLCLCGLLVIVCFLNACASTQQAEHHRRCCAQNYCCVT